MLLRTKFQPVGKIKIEQPHVVIIMLKCYNTVKSHLRIFGNFMEPFLNIKMQY